MQIGDGVWVKLPKGTEIECPNPYWNGDWPETQFNYTVKLQTDISVPLGGIKEWFNVEVLKVHDVASSRLRKKKEKK